MMNWSLYIQPSLPGNRLVEYSDGKVRLAFLRGGKRQEKSVVCRPVKAKKPGDR